MDHNPTNRARRTALVTATVGLWALLTSSVIPAHVALGQEPDGGLGNDVPAEEASRPNVAEDETVTLEVFSEDGTISQIEVTTEVAAPSTTRAAAASAEVVTIQSGGDSANRIDLVFVGDGYAAADMDTYSQHVRNMWDRLTASEPLATYKHYFNVYQVNVISTESGVDEDPRGIFRDTALDARFWCGGTERLLCVNVGKARQYAANAPGVDSVIVLANTAKYGGAGYGSGVATAAGGNYLAGEILLHELGHSIGGLADEYVYNPGLRYTGGEPSASNISIYERTAMEARQTKWFRWMGEISPDGGHVDTYEGASLGSYGVYRPTAGSLMRYLGRPFNLPGREAMVMAFYEFVSPIDATAPTNAVLEGTETASVSVLQPVGHNLEIMWSVDGKTVPGTRGDTELWLDTVDWPCAEDHVLAVTAVDQTAFVRDEGGRSHYMSATHSWLVERVEEIQIDVKPDGFPNKININGHGVVPVAVLGSESLDVTQIDIGSLDFAGLSVRTRRHRAPQCNFDDVNGDGYPDLKCQFADNAKEWTAYDSDRAAVTGNLACGTRFAGNDSIVLVP